MKTRKIQAVGIFLVMLLAVNKSSMASEDFNLSEVAEGVYVHLGVHVSFNNPQHDDIANIGFIVGEKCIAVIDTGGSVSIAKKLLGAIKQNSNKPICYVINTHVHYDHVLGNAVFNNESSIFVGHSNLADSINANREFFLNEYKNNLGEYANNDGIIAPSKLVDNSLQIDLGNRVLELKAWKTSHSHDDLTIFDKKTNTMWLSDLLFIGRIPAVDGNLKEWIEVTQEIEKQDYTTVIPGHGAVISDWKKAIQRQKDYLYVLLNQTRKMIAEGAFMEDVVDNVGQEEKERWILHEQHHKRNVSKAFTELEWE